MRAPPPPAIARQCFTLHASGHCCDTQWPSGSLELLSRAWAREEGQEAHPLPAVSEAHLPGFTVASTFNAPRSFPKLRNGLGADGTRDRWASRSPSGKVPSPGLQTWAPGPDPPPLVLRAPLCVPEPPRLPGATRAGVPPYLGLQVIPDPQPPARARGRVVLCAECNTRWVTCGWASQVPPAHSARRMGSWGVTPHPRARGQAHSLFSECWWLPFPACGGSPAGWRTGWAGPGGGGGWWCR